jgi:hypothetical protein
VRKAMETAAGVAKRIPKQEPECKILESDYIDFNRGNNSTSRTEIKHDR